MLYCHKHSAVRTISRSKRSTRCRIMRGSNNTTNVKFKNKQGWNLAGILQLAAADSKQKCVILCHGFQSHKNGFQLPAIADALADAGYNSFRFDFSGNGDSEGVFRFANYWVEVDEIHAAKQHVEDQEGQQVIALLGHSKAGGEVILYASRYDDIPLVINVAGRFWMDRGITMRFGEDIFDRTQAGPVTLATPREDGDIFEWQLTYEDLQERIHLDVAAAAANIKRSRFLTIHGTADAVIPVADGRQIVASIPGSKFVEVEGADHNFRASEEVRRQLTEAIVAFIAEASIEMNEAGS